MAVNIANELAAGGCKSYLCSTREEGPLEAMLNPDVQVLRLKKRSALDPVAIFALRRFIRQNSIQLIHAHSTSFFLAVIMKWMTRVKVVWHDHYGDSERLDRRKAHILRFFSRSFGAVVSVNRTLEQWANENLCGRPGKAVFLPNFPSLEATSSEESEGLPGMPESRIVCTARLHPQKDHETLIRAMAIIHERVPDAHLLLVGVDSKDDYSDSLKRTVEELELVSYVHILGGRTDVGGILKECSIGVLSSASEGLPVALLEYGVAGIAPVCTDVGDCAAVVRNGECGFVVPPGDPEALAAALTQLLGDSLLRVEMAREFRRHIDECYSASSAARKLIEIYDNVLEVSGR